VPTAPPRRPALAVPPEDAPAICWCRAGASGRPASRRSSNARPRGAGVTLPFLCRSAPTSHSTARTRASNRYRGRVGRLFRGDEEVGLVVLVEVEPYGEQVGGRLWWRRWGRTQDLLLVWTIVDGTRSDSLVPDDASEDELRDYDAGRSATTARRSACCGQTLLIRSAFGPRNLAGRCRWPLPMASLLAAWRAGGHGGVRVGWRYRRRRRSRSRQRACGHSLLRREKNALSRTVLSEGACGPAGRRPGSPRGARWPRATACCGRRSAERPDSTATSRTRG
jgi:hypothetical protein